MLILMEVELVIFQDNVFICRITDQTGVYELRSTLALSGVGGLFVGFCFTFYS